MGSDLTCSCLQLALVLNTGQAAHNTKGHCHPRASSAKTRGVHTQLDEAMQLKMALLS